MADIYRDIDMERFEQGAKWSRPHYWGHGDCSSNDVALEVKEMVLAVSVLALSGRWLSVGVGNVPS